MAERAGMSAAAVTEEPDWSAASGLDSGALPFADCGGASGSMCGMRHGAVGVRRRTFREVVEGRLGATEGCGRD